VGRNRLHGVPLVAAPPSSEGSTYRDCSRRHQRLRPHRPQLLPGRRGLRRRHRDRRRQRPDRQQDHRAPAQVRLGPRCLDDDVTSTDDSITVGGKTIKVFAEKRPADLAWGDVGADIVIESTGFFTDATKAKPTSTAAPRRSSSPRRPRTRTPPSSWASTTSDYDPAKHHVISNASCTTNCLGPDGQGLNDELGIVKGLMTTVHAYTQDQNLLDGPHKRPASRPRRRAVIIPTTTGAAKAIGLVMPELKGKLDGYALRVPDPDRLGHRPHLRGRPRDHRRGGQRDRQGCCRGSAQGLPEVHRGPDRLEPTSSPTRTPASSTRSDQGHRQPGQGRRLVRQRVGLLQPPRRPGSSSARASESAGPSRP
jgi:hypothetical protein